MLEIEIEGNLHALFTLKIDAEGKVINVTSDTNILIPLI